MHALAKQRTTPVLERSLSEGLVQQWDGTAAARVLEAPVLILSRRAIPWQRWLVGGAVPSSAVQSLRFRQSRSHSLARRIRSRRHWAVGRTPRQGSRSALGAKSQGESNAVLRQPARATGEGGWAALTLEVAADLEEVRTDRGGDAWHRLAAAAVGAVVEVAPVQWAR